MMEQDLFSSSIDGDDAKKLVNLDVVKMEYVAAESKPWEELFSGFDSLKAITFSSGISFVCKLLECFTDAEIIFGCEDVMSGTLQDIMAFQTTLIKNLRTRSGKAYDTLTDRITNGSLRLFVARGRLSHEKIYLLSSSDGRKRVIMGSANMSYNAFGGRQRENICYLDGDKAYDWYDHVYTSLRRNSSDSITKTALLIADSEENIGALPISETVKVEKAVVLDVAKDVSDDIKFVLDCKNLSKELAPCMPASANPDRKTGRIRLVPESIIMVRRQVEEAVARQKQSRSENPQLDIDVNRGVVTLNGKELDLHPSAKEIQSDVAYYLRYMNGYSRFHGEWQEMQMRYFEFANWFFCSPFMAAMRDAAARFNQNRLPYPVFGLLYGQSKAGKTSFLETLLKMMIGQKTKISAPEFTRKEIATLKTVVHGAPIIVDDLTQIRFNQHAVEIIKWDDFGIDQNNVNYPAVVISANEDVKAIAQEVTRRTVICRVQAGLTNTEVMKSNTVRVCQENLGTAFYREYLRRMLDIVPSLIEELKSPAVEGNADEGSLGSATSRTDEESGQRDILAVSSNILCDIISEYGGEKPPYIRSLSLDSYFSEEVTGKYAIKAIQMAWRTSRASFRVSEKNNELRYNAGATFEVDRLIKELPETLEPRKSRDWLIVNLDVARAFFKVNFKPKLLERVLGG